MLNREESNFETVYGPEGLKEKLESLLTANHSDFPPSEHSYLYQKQNQKSLIEINHEQNTYHFWYYDLLGRPATEAVKEVVGRFLWEQCGHKELFLSDLIQRPSDEEAYTLWKANQFKQYFHDVSGAELHKEQANFLSGGSWVPHHKIFDANQAKIKIAQAKKEILTEALIAPAVKEPSAKGWMSFFDHSNKSDMAHSKLESIDEKPENKKNKI